MNIFYIIFFYLSVSVFLSDQNPHVYDVNFDYVSDTTKIETPPIDTLLVDSSLFVQNQPISKSDSLKFKEMKKFNPTLWDKINEETLCTGMKAPVQYRNGKVVRNN